MREGRQRSGSDWPYARLGGVALMLCLAACVPARNPMVSSPPPAAPARSDAEQPSFSQLGAASWYRSAGGTTASGELYDARAMTAAHPTLPLGTIVRVTNLANGQTVKVRINDRGPFVPGRVVDLSAAAARGLGIVNDGEAQVRVEEFTSDQL